MNVDHAEYVTEECLRLVIDGKETFVFEPKGTIHDGYIYLSGDDFEGKMPETVCPNGYRSKSLTNDPVIVCLVFRFIRDVRKRKTKIGPTPIPSVEEAKAVLRPTLADYLECFGDSIPR